MKFIMLLIFFVKSLFVPHKPVQSIVKRPELPLRLNIQFFADDGAEGADDKDKDDKGDDKKDDEEKKDEAEFTKEQQAKIDALIAKTVARERANRDKAIEDARTEAEKLAKMNADQKAEYEQQQRESKILEREADITRRELRATALETLAEKGLPKTLAEILVFTDAASTNASLDAVEKAFRESVEAGVNERLRGGNPPGGGGQGGSGSQKNPFKPGPDFNLTEQGRLFKENPELYKQLKAQA
ncbi:DUF4355 domain-containing protein [Sporosarcina sp. FSL K6-3457]|uniref:DUF4355 domain-containing protein n=1 Tax=Sporosarcina sp. FSL K6-3457 TaxID=2978204 RepID=UPI0030F9BEB9